VVGECFATPNIHLDAGNICSNLSSKWLQVCGYPIVQVLQSATTKSTQIGIVETCLDHV
jgi:hypothetical protein